MELQNVLSIIHWLHESRINVWVDGGWCVDALLGRQTRDHDDLDIAVHRKDNARLRELLTSGGYTEVPRSDSSELMYVMKNGAGLQIDIHVFAYDADGRNTYGIEYPFGSLTGRGILGGQAVDCIDPKWMFKFKTAYVPKDKDIKDVQLLYERFGFALPEGKSNWWDLKD